MFKKNFLTAALLFCVFAALPTATSGFVGGYPVGPIVTGKGCSASAIAGAWRDDETGATWKITDEGEMRCEGKCKYSYRWASDSRTTSVGRPLAYEFIKNNAGITIFWSTGKETTRSCNLIARGRVLNIEDIVSLRRAD